MKNDVKEKEMPGHIIDKENSDEENFDEEN